MKTTIQEALAELKTVGKRIEKKQAFVLAYLARQERFKDPHDKDGGSFKLIVQERQSIRDLESRIVAIRQAINAANADAILEIAGVSRTIAEWLVWRREVAPRQEQFFQQLAKSISQTRREAQAKGVQILPGDVKASADTDVLINLNEKELAEEIERLETILGKLDGQLSLTNAITVISIPD